MGAVRLHQDDVEALLPLEQIDLLGAWPHRLAAGPIEVAEQHQLHRFIGQCLAAGQLTNGVGLDQQGAPRGGGGQKHPGAGGEQHLLALLMEIVGQPEEGAGFPPGAAKTN